MEIRISKFRAITDVRRRELVYLICNVVDGEQRGAPPMHVDMASRYLRKRSPPPFLQPGESVDYNVKRESFFSQTWFRTGPIKRFSVTSVSVASDFPDDR